MNEQQNNTKGDKLVYAIFGAFIGFGIAELTRDITTYSGFLSVLAVAATGAMASFFLRFCYQPGAIFGWYMDLLEKNIRDNPKSLFKPFFSPLGGCMYCQNTWVTFFFYVAAIYKFGLSWWYVLPCIFLSHLVLSIIDKEYS